MSITTTFGNFDLKELRILPTPSVDEAVTAPTQGEIRKIAESVLGGLKYSFATAAASSAETLQAGSIEADMHSALATLAKDRQEHFAGVASKLVTAPESARLAMFGNAGVLDATTFVRKGGFDSFTTNVTLPKIDKKLLGLKGDQFIVPLTRLSAQEGALTVEGEALTAERVAAAADKAEEARIETGVVNHDRLADVWGPVIEGDPFEGMVVGEDFEPFADPSNMGLWITEVKCVDETNPEWWGSDEIALAGIETDEDGDTRPINEVYIGGGFDDGDRKTYPNWRYTTFNMNEGNYWPKKYLVAFILAEKDHGGLQAFLDRVWKSVRDQVKAAIAKAIGAGLSAYLGPVIANAIGAAVAWIVDVFVGWLINLFGDDIFPIQTVSVTTPSKSARWYYPNGQWGNPSSGIRVANFYGHGGHYQVKYYWKIHG